MKRILASVLMAMLVVTAGCAGSGLGGANGTETDRTTTPGEGAQASRGTVNFYVSDERNAIDQFEHLNVTITKIGLKRVDAGEEGSEETAEPTATTTTTAATTTAAPENGTAANETAENGTTRTATPNGTVTATPTAAPTTDGEGDDGGQSEEGEAKSGWVTREINETTVDLTELQGPNASKLSVLHVPDGTYTKVFVYVSEVNGTLKNGEHVNVKLPSQRLHLNKEFTVGADEEIDFVFDITVFEAGKSGKYVLKPVVSESGTGDEVEIEPVEKGGDKKNRDKKDRDERTSLNATFVGNVTAGENATLQVTRNGSVVANATVEVDGEDVGRTGENGTVTFALPADAEDVEIKVTAGDAELEFEYDLSVGATAGGGEDSKSGKKRGSDKKALSAV
jgi:hypothetical protein